MALIKCPECGKKVSDKTAMCIHCGYPVETDQTGSLPSDQNNLEQEPLTEVKMDKKKKLFVVVGIAAAIALMLSVIVIFIVNGISKKPSFATDPSSSQTTTSTSTETTNTDSSGESTETLSTEDTTGSSNETSESAKNEPPTTQSPGTQPPVSDAPTNEAKITASTTAVSMNGSSKVVYITLLNWDSLEYDIADSSIVDCEWGDWDGDTIPLTFIPISSGKTSVKVYPEGLNSGITINVSVSLNTEGDNQHTHTYSTKDVSPTCTEQGYTEYKCNCGYAYNDNYKPANGHAIVIDEAVDATTSSTGLTQGEHCSVCNKVLVKQEVIPKLEPSPAESTKLTINGIGNTYNYYLPTEKKSSTYIHSGDYEVASIGTSYIELQVDLIAELTYANSKHIAFRYELYDSNGICVKSGSIFKSADLGVKYNIHMTLPVSKTGNYTLKLCDY